MKTTLFLSRTMHLGTCAYTNKLNLFERLRRCQMKKLNNLTNKNKSNSFMRFRYNVCLLCDVLMLFISIRNSLFIKKSDPVLVLIRFCHTTEQLTPSKMIINQSWLVINGKETHTFFVYVLEEKLYFF